MKKLVRVLIVLTIFFNVLESFAFSKNKSYNYLGVSFSYAEFFEWGTGKVNTADKYSLMRMPLLAELFYDWNAGKGFGMSFSAGYKVYDIMKSEYSYFPDDISYSSWEYSIKQSLITTDILLRIGFRDTGIIGDYLGLGLKLLFYGTPTFTNEDTDKKITDSKFKETDVSLYLSVGKRDFLRNFGKVIIPAKIKAGLLLTPGFSEIDEAKWKGFFIEVTFGCGFNL